MVYSFPGQAQHIPCMVKHDLTSNVSVAVLFAMLKISQLFGWFWINKWFCS